jgi:hypothetical protein
VRRLFYLLLLAAPLGAQDSTAAADSTPRVLPREIALQAASYFNAPRTLRVVGRLDIAAGQTIPGDVAVIDGPFTIAGHVAGHVTAINTTIELAPGAQIDSGLLVVGGDIHNPSPDSIHVEGAVLLFAQHLKYHPDGELIVAETEGDATASWWSRWLNRRRSANYTGITLSSAHTYNRVEGLPVYLGPTLRRALPWGAFSVDALGIVRTGDPAWNEQTFGYRLRSDVRIGHGPGSVTFTSRAYDEVAPVEDWQLSDAEVGLSSFLFRRDYRDYYERHGGSEQASLNEGDAQFHLGYAIEHWNSRDAVDPLYLIRTEGHWRPNPSLDNGTFRTVTGGFTIDTRDDLDNPWAGWYVRADGEFGYGRVSQFGARSPGPGPVLDAPGPPQPLSPEAQSVVGPGVAQDYFRGFFDVRRYNRLTPTNQFNLRAVLGGWLGGDQLPLEQRLSVGGPGTIPGYAFRDQGDLVTDVASCAGGPVPPGRPAQCDRIALAQAEFRNTFHISIGNVAHGHGFQTDGAVVAFTDAGRGWLVGPREGTLQYPANAFPAPDTFLTDVGVGVMIDPVGVYVAKSLSTIGERPHFELRLRRRF